MKKQAFNPFLPLDTYIPDGEPHVFGDRIYLFGSHDSEGGQRYCAEGNYIGWSAPVDDLSDWRCDGVIYEAAQDPRVHGDFADLYAPDVVRGNDGRYYLYYGISGGVGHAADGHNTPIGVAVCDTPTGKYEYLGFVRNPDGSPFLKYLPADPAVINDGGIIRLYYGWALSMVAAGAHSGNEGRGGDGQPLPDIRSMPKEQLRHFLLGVEQMLFHRTKEQLLAEPEDVMGANHVVLAEDMLTVISEPTRIVPSQFMALGTDFEGHGFYEASSIRKINGTYYFIYSDENSNMLCYATSPYPDRDFRYRGILQSNGDVGLNGRRGEDRLNMTANNHGSLECINGQWYIFYHRQTHNSTYSRQACAEPVTILPDGSIAQVPCTSCGLNGGPLVAEGLYPAPIACNLTNGHMPHATNRVVNADIPFITHGDGQRYITGIKDGTLIGYKYFRFCDCKKLTLSLRGAAGGQLLLSLDEEGTQPIGAITVSPREDWTDFHASLTVSGTHPLYLRYQGTGMLELLQLRFS